MLHEMLLAWEDLPPGDWADPVESIYRNMGKRSEYEEIVRAWRAKTSTGQRLWTTRTGGRSVVDFVKLLASEEDARSYAPNFIKARLRAPFVRLHNEIERKIDLDSVKLSHLADLNVYEVTYTIRGRSCRDKMVTGTAVSAVFMISAHDDSNAWTWDEVASIADRQLERIRRHLVRMGDTDWPQGKTHII